MSDHTIEQATHATFFMQILIKVNCKIAHNRAGVRAVFIQIVATLIRVLQTTAIGLSRGSGVIATLRYIIWILLPSWQKVADSQLAIRVATLRDWKRLQATYP